MAGPGAPSRPPPAAPHRPACRGARLTQGPAPGDIASRGLAELRCAPLPAPPPELLRHPPQSPQTTAAASGSAGPAWSGAGRQRRRDPSGGSGVGAAAPRACPSPPPEPRGACARGGGAHVRVFVSEPDPRQRAGSVSLGMCRGSGPGDGNCKEGGSGPLTSLLHLASPYPNPLLLTKTTRRKSGSN